MSSWLEKAKEKAKKTYDSVDSFAQEKYTEAADGARKLSETSKETFSHVSETTNKMYYRSSDTLKYMNPEEMNVVGTPIPLKESDNCIVCAVKFDWLKGPKRHHCRSCGESHCDAHSPFQDYVPTYGWVKPQKTCLKCHVELQKTAYRVRIGMYNTSAL